MHIECGCLQEITSSLGSSTAPTVIGRMLWLKKRSVSSFAIARVPASGGDVRGSEGAAAGAAAGKVSTPAVVIDRHSRVSILQCVYLREASSSVCLSVWRSTVEIQVNLSHSFVKEWVHIVSGDSHISSMILISVWESLPDAYYIHHRTEFTLAGWHHHMPSMLLEL